LPDLISIGLAWFLAWLFAQAAIHKFRAPDDYRRLVAAYLGKSSISRFTIGLIAAVELTVAALLLLPMSREVGLVGSTLMLLAYSGLMGLQLARGRLDLQCGCAGPASTTNITPSLVFRNFICVSLALIAMAPATVVTTGLFSAGLSIFIAVFLMLIYLGSEQMISNAQQMAGGR